MEWLNELSVAFTFFFLYFCVQTLGFAIMAKIAKSEYVRSYHRSMQRYSFWALIFFGWCGILVNIILAYLGE